MVGRPDAFRALARFDGRELAAAVDGRRARYEGAGFSLAFDISDPEGTLAGTADEGVVVDMAQFQVTRWFAEALLATGAVNYVSCLDPA